ncbi:putative nuclease HARBI1 [Impatiens glandulifera]|uniref:putative nuclease HARBI1 n=1 Tax=Impatiens glandulifera TaxID=253017 RepID=UPI001FB196C5|nr:putative nuclease HARBI1 [Impatiens glandulifera]
MADTNLIPSTFYSCVEEATENIVEEMDDIYLERMSHRAYTNGFVLVQKLLHNPSSCLFEFRMDSIAFNMLVNELTTKYGLNNQNKGLFPEESLAMFLRQVGQHAATMSNQTWFKYSTETINRHFHRVLKALVLMANDQILPVDQKIVHPKLREEKYKYFKNCIGAIDGTHIKLFGPKEEIIKYIGRKGYSTQNILAVCDFDMCFTYASVGWEGSAHDAGILKTVISDPNYRFPHPLSNKYYLVDAGYKNKRGYLAPYRQTLYHMEEIQRCPPPNSSQTTFNKIHSSLRTTIERTFGVWKKKWRILENLCGFSIKTQTHIVVATMCLHNFVRRNVIDEGVDDNAEDGHSNNNYDDDENDYILEESIDHNEGEEMRVFRDSLASKLWQRRCRERAM